jgi:hypothetical protein
MASFGLELAELIQKHYPLSVKGDADQLARVTADIAITFGGLIAISVRLTGKDKAEGIIRKMIEVMFQQAGVIDKMAIEKLFPKTQGNA